MTDNFSGLLDSFLSLLISRRDPTIERFLDGVPREMPVRDLAAKSLACTRHLNAATSQANAETAPLLNAFAAAADTLQWGQTYSASDLGSTFLENYGWVELFGTRGHFANDSVAGGFLVLGRQTHYPDHHHVAEEIYLPLTGGTDWRMGEDDFVERPAGDIIHHASNVNHAMRTKDAPLVAIYLWRGGPLAAKSTLAK